MPGDKTVRSPASLYPLRRLSDDADSETPKPSRLPPMAVTLEILEPAHVTEDTMGGSIIIPREVRINGVSVLTPQEHPIRIHEMQVGGELEAAIVTITLFVRKLVIAAEGDLS
jgi:hypothetical protein